MFQKLKGNSLGADESMANDVRSSCTDLAKSWFDDANYSKKAVLGLLHTGMDLMQEEFVGCISQAEETGSVDSHTLLRVTVFVILVSSCADVLADEKSPFGVESIVDSICGQVLRKTDNLSVYDLARSHGVMQ